MKRGFLAILLLVALCLTACPASAPQGTTTASTAGQNRPSSPNQPDKPEKEEEPVISPENYTEGKLLYAEQFRQQFHYSDKNSWMNDINGSVYFNGTWHMYYQCNDGTTKNNTNEMYWGHATSPDLIHWTQHAPALAPDADGAMWSGTCTVDPDNRTGLFKTDKGGIIAAYSTEKQEMGIAYSEDGYTFEKLGIVIRNPGPGRVDFRDPKIFWDESNGKWTVCIAGGKVRFYQSSDLVNWSLTSENELWTECPDFFPLTVEGEETVKWVLSCAGTSFYIGSYANGRFTPETGRISPSAGPDAYAGIIFDHEPSGRALFVHWANRWEYAQQTATDWVSNASLVSELKLRRTGTGLTVGFDTVEFYESITEEPMIKISDRIVDKGEDILAGIEATLFRLDLTVDLTASTDFTLKMRNSKDERITLTYNNTSGKFFFDRSASLAGCAALSEVNPFYTFSSDASDGRTLTLTVYVDASMVDMYIDHTTYFAAIAQPSAASRGLSLTTEGTLLVKNLAVRELKSIWFEDMKQVGSVQTKDAKSYEIVVAEGAYFVPASSYCGIWPLHVTVEEGSEFFRAEAVEGGVLLTPLAEGEGTVRLRSLGRYIDVPVKVYAETLRESMLEDFTVSGGTLETTPNGFTLTAVGGDAFAISTVGASDFIYRAEIVLTEEVHAGALAFRMNGTSDFYCVCIDKWSQYVKLWMRDGGSVRDVKTVSLRVEAGVTYQLEIEAVGSTIKVKVNGKDIMTVVETTHTYGAFGINTYMGAADFNKISYEKVEHGDSASGAVSDIESFQTLAGTLLNSPDGYLFTNASGDGFARSNVVLDDFVYEADVTFQGAQGLALVIRMTDSSNFYCICLSKGDRVAKIWKKDRGTVSNVITERMTFEEGGTYHLRVEAVGEQLTVFLDGVEILSVRDSSHATGALGLNVFCGSALFNNIKYEEK